MTTRLVIAIFVVASCAEAQQPAFPGAEGFGAYALGGRSGTVYHVTHLGNSGSGSFRDAVSQPNRTVVFDISGIIDIPSNQPVSIAKSNITVAGQTAPGDGITTRGGLTQVSGTRNVIVRFLRCRPGDTNCPNYMDDSFNVVRGTNVIVDHVSGSWDNDEVLSVTHFSTNVTVQWCMIAEPLNYSCHDEGTGIQQHGYGTLIRFGGAGVTFHHNLYAHNKSRVPRLGDNYRLDWVNNVIYNWGDTCGYNANDNADTPGFTNWLNYVNNYLIIGTNTTQNPPRAFKSDSTINPGQCQIYQAGNLIDTNKTGQLRGYDKGWASFTGNFTTNLTRFPFPQVTTDTPTGAYVRVLSAVGASLLRDAVDADIVSNVITRTGKIIDSQSQVGGWPTVYSRPTPTDTDQDGMPNFWELALGLNINNAADRNNLMADGYTRLEQYLNWLAGPRASCETNACAYVDLRQYSAGLTGTSFTVSSPTNGVVTLLSDGSNAQFTPTAGFAGLAGFQFIGTGTPGTLTGTVNVLVSPTNVAGNLVWRGDGTTNRWDTLGSANWVGAAMPVRFYAGDIVTFDNTGSNNPAINLAGTILPSSVIVTGSQNYSFGGTGSLGGMMDLIKAGAGTLTIMTSNTFGGGTVISNGALLIHGTLGTGGLLVTSGGTLGGTGIVHGPVTVNGTLAPGASVGTFTISNDLTVSSGTLAYQLGTTSDQTTVSGHLALSGTLNITDAGGFGTNTYTLFAYGGTLDYGGINIGAAPSGYTYAINTNTVGQVQLEVMPALSAFEQWQMAYFGSTNNPAAAAEFDADGDGQDNDAEFRSGTIPTNSLSVLRIISIERQTNDFVVTWATAGGRTNAVQAAANIGTNFLDLSGLIVIPGSGDSTANYTDVGGATNDPTRFYRVRLVP